jgi:hypothetical protein
MVVMVAVIFFVSIPMAMGVVQGKNPNPGTQHPEMTEEANHKPTCQISSDDTSSFPPARDNTLLQFSPT